jgi:hypothetical protein
LSRDSAATVEAVAEEDADACVSIRFISMFFYQLRKGMWQRQSFRLADHAFGVTLHGRRFNAVTL